MIHQQVDDRLQLGLLPKLGQDMVIPLHARYEGFADVILSQVLLVMGEEARYEDFLVHAVVMANAFQSLE